MKPQYPHLCSPIRIGKVTFRNRMFSAPMGATEITADHCVTYRTQGFYELRAKGGAVVGAAVLVDRSGGRARFDVPHASLLQLSLPTWTPEECELCKKGLPLDVPGSK